MAKICAPFDLPKPSGNKPFNIILRNVSKNAEEIAEQKMKEAADRLVDIVKSETPVLIENPPDGNIVANVSVTVDGTCQGRGHGSNNGVMFLISVRTSEILDYIVKTNYCHECTSHEKVDRTSQKCLHWQSKHMKGCCISHFGSSGSKEKAGAIDMFLRSIVKRSLKYTVFVEDGATDCFGSVRHECRRVYGDSYIVTKEECIGHVQKS